MNPISPISPASTSSPSLSATRAIWQSIEANSGTKISSPASPFSYTNSDSLIRHFIYAIEPSIKQANFHLQSLSWLELSFKGTEIIRAIQSCFLQVTNVFYEIKDQINNPSNLNFKLTFAPITLQQIKKLCSQDTKYLARARAIEVQFDFLELPLLYGDIYRVNQVLVNLISNAIKYSPPYQTVMVRAKLHRETPEYYFVRFEVSDKGPGISQNDQLHLFQCFGQCSQSSEDNQQMEKTGLGLYLSYSLSRQLNPCDEETIGVVSQLGEGSTFWFVVRFYKANSFQRFEPSQQPEPRVEETLSNFSCYLVHEIKTPLHSCMVAINELRKIYIPKSHEGVLTHELALAIYKQKYLVDNLLILKKIEEKKIQPKLEPFCLQDLVETIERETELLPYLFSRKLSRMMPSYCSTLMVSKRIQSGVMINLIVYASQLAQPESTVEWTIETEMVGQEEIQLLFKVNASIKRDDSCPKPIPEDFFILQSDLKKKDSDNWLLYTAHNLNRLINNNDDASANLSLQLNEGEQKIVLWVKMLFQILNQTIISRKVQMELDTSLSPYKILVIDDSILAQKLAKIALEKAGCIHCNTLYSGEQCLKDLHFQDYDVILIDLFMEMGGINGLETAMEIRKKEEEMEVKEPVVLILYSGMPLDEIKDQAMRAGFNYVLEKPAKPEDIVKTILSLSPRQSLSCPATSG